MPLIDGTLQTKIDVSTRGCPVLLCSTKYEKDCANRDGTAMAMMRVFISFDYDHDDDLRVLLVGQSRNPDSPFEIADCSLKEPLTGNWKEKIRPRIRSVSQVAVICGQYTDSAIGVSAEVEIARDEGKPYFLLAGRAAGGNKKPVSALSIDKMYKWTWENLKILIRGGR